MARKKRKTAAPRRRRRMSGIGSSAMINTAIYAIGGAVAGQAIRKFLPASMDDKIKAAIPLAVGLFVVPNFMKGPTGAALSMGLVATGGLNLVQQFGILNGIGETPMIAAFRNMRQLNGVDDISTDSVPAVAGISPELSAMDVALYA